MTGKQRYQRAANARAERKEDRVQTFSGTLGITTNAENQVEVPGMNETIQAFNESVSPVFGLPVLVEWDKDSPIRYKVRGRDIGRYTVWVTTNAAGDTVSDTSAYLPAHGASHSFNKLTGVGGGDIVWVYGDQFIPWLVTPSGSAGSLSVSVQPSAYYYDNQFRWAGGTGIAGFENYYPTGSSNARMLLIYLDPDTGNPYIATGTLTEFANTITGTQQIMPYMPSLIEETDIPLAGVRLITGTSKIMWQNLYDLRDYFAHSSVSGSSGGGGAPTDAQYVVMALDGDLSAERVLTAGTDVTLTDGGAGGNATVGVATGTFSRAGHGHLYPYSVAIYDDHVFKATGTILDFTGNIDVAVTGTSVFISSTAAGGGGSTVLIYDDSTFKVTGTAISFDDNLTVHVTGSTAYVIGQAGGAGGFPIIYDDSIFKNTGVAISFDEDIEAVATGTTSYVGIPTGTFSRPGHTHAETNTLLFYEDDVFVATGTAIDFGTNVNVAVTGSVIFISTIDTTGGGGGDLLIYDVTGTALDFGDNISVVVTGSVAYIDASGATGPPGDNTLLVYDDSVFVATGTAISFDEGLDVVSTGTNAYVSMLTNGWMYARQDWTYESADDPTYTFTIGENVTGTYSPGMRLRLDQSTGGTKYFILTDLSFSGSSTTMTIYGGTDYNLENEAITNPYYSVMKSPYGFPLSPIKWTAQSSDTSQRVQATPTQNTWYNLGSLSLDIPIGVWKVHYMVIAQGNDSSSANWVIQTALSTANNSASDSDLTTSQIVGSINVSAPCFREKHLDLSSKTTYYLNTRTIASTLDNLVNRNDESTAFIRAVCAYL